MKTSCYAALAALAATAPPTSRCARAPPARQTPTVRRCSLASITARRRTPARARASSATLTAAHPGSSPPCQHLAELERRVSGRAGQGGGRRQAGAGHRQAVHLDRLHVPVLQHRPAACRASRRAGISLPSRRPPVGPAAVNGVPNLALAACAGTRSGCMYGATCSNSLVTRLGEIKCTDGVWGSIRSSCAPQRRHATCPTPASGAPTATPCRHGLWPAHRDGQLVHVQRLRRQRELRRRRTATGLARGWQVRTHHGRAHIRAHGVAHGGANACPHAGVGHYKVIRSTSA